MAHSIPHVLRRIKEDWPQVLTPRRIEDACRAAGHTWRHRALPPARTVYLFMLQILHGNIACSALRHLSGEAVSASAYCQARARLPLAAIQALAAKVIHGLVASSEGEGLWHSHRVIHVDGSGFSMPDTEALQAHFGQPGNQKKGCGFPVAHWCAIVHAGTGMLIDLMASPLRTHDMSSGVKLHAKMRPNDILVGDRAFCSYAHLALILQGRMHAVLRVHQRQIVDFRPGRLARQQVPKNRRKGKPTSLFVRKLSQYDQWVRWVKPPTPPGWMSAEQFALLPDTILMRELRYAIRRRGFRTRTVTLATTLLDADVYPKDELAEVYQQRWQIEVNFRHLKQTMGMDVLRCRTVDGVMKELWMFALVYNLVRATMVNAARQQGVPPDRISFVDALRWLRYLRPHHSLYAFIVNPQRQGRAEPRVRKRRPKEFPVMKKPRSEWRKLLAKQQVAA
jgi:hypothetical protein